MSTLLVIKKQFTVFQKIFPTRFQKKIVRFVQKPIIGQSILWVESYRWFVFERIDPKTLMAQEVALGKKQNEN